VFDKVTLVAFIDFLIQLLLAMIIIAMTRVEIEQSSNGDIDALSDYMIIVTWGEGSRDDIDLFVQAPDGTAVWYQNKEGSLLYLDRDDMGNSVTTMVVDGEVKGTNIHREVVYLKDTIAGDYVINLFMYSKRNKESTNVKIEIIQLHPYTIVEEKNVILSVDGQEETVVVLTMNKVGEITDRSYIFMPLVENYLVLQPSAGTVRP